MFDLAGRGYGVIFRREVYLNRQVFQPGQEAIGDILLKGNLRDYPLFTLLEDRFEASTIRYIYQAFILLHELGHVFNLRSSTAGLLYGGSSIQEGDASNATLQSQNNNLVFNNCIAPYFGLSPR